MIIKKVYQKKAKDSDFLIISMYAAVLDEWN